ncbi:hypothetical protein ACJ6WF_08460 [Streptomyces sp. MMS24-I2-30]|uniref:hypothetical protein n=1 Tax=Streptomyces sp. MMS24-I2-30 TaxID=3351564 RepID=UPI003896D808
MPPDRALLDHALPDRSLLDRSLLDHALLGDALLGRVRCATHREPHIASHTPLSRGTPPVRRKPLIRVRRSGADPAVPAAPTPPFERAQSAP